MIILNFAHPLTPEHRQQIEELAGQPIERVIDISSQIDQQQPLAAQVAALADQAGLSPAEWQTLPLLVNPPALNFTSVTLLAELHGRIGHFPTIVRLRPVAGSTPTRYEVAEVINLQAARDTARSRRPHAPAG